MTLPIRKLTLYKHGISVVERANQVTGDSVTLTFHRDQMNDVLKSLVAFDRAGGQVRNIAYDAPEERKKKLARGSIHLSDHASLVDLLRDLRGRQVKVQLQQQPDAILGLVIGLDLEHETRFKEGRLSMLTAQGIQVLKLQDVEQVSLQDEQASSDLDFFLRTSIAEPKQRTVTLRLSEGEHDIVVRYLAPSPTWRVSYRFVGSVEEDGTRTALLQGWGIFDNPFDEALEEVRLSLVSGMPISFVYDLYTPFTPKRPEVKEEARVAAAPIEMERPRMRTRGGSRQFMRHSLSSEAAFASPVAAAADIEEFSLQDALSGSTMVAAEGEAQGDLFEYRIAYPVTVQRGEAAMVPILTTELPYRKEYIYNERKMPRHPSVVLRFENSSDLTLERGPITVMEEDTYVGEAIFPFTRPAAEVLLAIAVDLAVSVRKEIKTSRQTHQIRIDRQLLLFHEWTSQETTYEITNTNSEALELLIEHPRQHRFELFEMPEPFEQTEQHYRFAVHVPAGAEGNALFKVYERRSEQRREQLSALNGQKLRSYLGNGWLDRALGNQLANLLKLYAEKEQVKKRLTKIEKERQRLMAMQEQSRKNMSGLKDIGDEGTLRARYVRQLNQAEDNLSTYEDERIALQKQEQKQEERIAAHIASLS